MSLKIRLKRAGSKKRPFYRVVVTDSRRARDSRSIEDIGYYNPLEDPVVVNVDRDKVAQWTSQGAIASETVQALLRRENTAHASRREIPDFTADAPRPRPEPMAREGERVRGKGRGKPRDAAAPRAMADQAATKAPQAEPTKVGPAVDDTLKSSGTPTAEAPAQELAQDEAPTQPVEAPAEAEAEAESGAEGSEPKPES